MNNKTKNTIDKSTPYRNFGMGKITAPTKPENEPKATRRQGEDLRGKRG